MPIWNGKSIPFDPEIIAGLLFRGEEITPDEGISDQQLEYEQSLINEHLQKLWGDQQKKVLDASQQNSSQGEEALGKIPNPKDDKTVMGLENENINFKQVVPNPFLWQNMPVIDELPIAPDSIQAKRPMTKEEFYSRAKRRSEIA